MENFWHIEPKPMLCAGSDMRSQRFRRYSVMQSYLLVVCGLAFSVPSVAEGCRRVSRLVYVPEI